MMPYILKSWNFLGGCGYKIYNMTTGVNPKFTQYDNYKKPI